MADLALLRLRPHRLFLNDEGANEEVQARKTRLEVYRGWIEDGEAREAELNERVTIARERMEDMMTCIEELEEGERQTGERMEEIRARIEELEEGERLAKGRADEAKTQLQLAQEAITGFQEHFDTLETTLASTQKRGNVWYKAATNCEGWLRTALEQLQAMETRALAAEEGRERAEQMLETRDAKLREHKERAEVLEATLQEAQNDRVAADRPSDSDHHNLQRLDKWSIIMRTRCLAQEARSRTAEERADKTAKDLEDALFFGFLLQAAHDETTDVRERVAAAENRASDAEQRLQLAEGEIQMLKKSLKERAANRDRQLQIQHLAKQRLQLAEANRHGQLQNQQGEACDEVDRLIGPTPEFQETHGELEAATQKQTQPSHIQIILRSRQMKKLEDVRCSIFPVHLFHFLGCFALCCIIHIVSRSCMDASLMAQDCTS